MTRNTGVVGIFSDSGKFYPVPNLPYVYMHKDGCGGPAFMADHIPTGSTFATDSEGFFYLNGESFLFSGMFIRGDSFFCGTCKRYLGDLKPEHIKKTVAG